MRLLQMLVPRLLMQLKRLTNPLNQVQLPTLRLQMVIPLQLLDGAVQSLNQVLMFIFGPEQPLC